MTIDSQGMRVSTDDGAPWSEARPVCEGLNDKEPSSHRVVRMKSDALVMVHLDFTDYKFGWDEEAGEPKDDCRMEVWAIRSVDGGKTWTDRQRLHDGYNANFFGFIQTSAGRLVVVLKHLISNPGH